MKIEEVHFNHDPTAATSDALTLRKNAGGSPVVAPEWRAGHPAQPVAYAVQALSGTVTIKARVSGGLPGTTVEIRALDAYLPPASPSGCLGWLFSLIARILRALFGNVLGDVKKRHVTFDAAGDTGARTFGLENHKLETSPVGKRSTTWKWQARQDGSWVDIGTTQHDYYLVLDVPRGPWQQGGGANNTQLPWADALEKACLWGLGATTQDEAAKKITEAINTQPLQSYVPATLFGFYTYNLSSYLAALDGGAPFSLNCTDCANAVTTFSNLLGCDLWEGIFRNMQTRKFLTLNGDPSDLSDWVPWGWSYHEICWLGGAMGADERIYDGCLRVDMDDDYSDDVHVARLPVKMKFGSNGPNDYRYRLVESGNASLDPPSQQRTVT